MSILDKFRKRKEKEKDFLELDEAMDEGKNTYGPAGEEEVKEEDLTSLPAMPEVPKPPETESFLKKDMEVLNLKLSAIASEIEALKLRVRLIEGKLGLRPDENPVQIPKQEEWHY